VNRSEFRCDIRPEFLFAFAHGQSSIVVGKTHGMQGFGGRWPAQRRIERQEFEKNRGPGSRRARDHDRGFDFLRGQRRFRGPFALDQITPAAYAAGMEQKNREAA
jgi:hypothetical protein